MKNIFLISLFGGFLFHHVNAQQLGYFITQGLQNSPLLNEYRNQASASATDSLLVRASQLPQVNSTSQVMYAPAYKNFGYDNAITNGGNYASVVGVSQNIFNSKSLKSKYEGINIQKQAWLNNGKISTADLKKVITAQYLTAYMSYSDMNNSRSYLTLLNQYKDILKQLVDGGVYRQTDYLALMLELQTAEIDFNQQQTQFTSDTYMLRQLCGITDTAAFVPEILVFNIPQPGNIQNSPLFVRFKIDSLSINNEQQALSLNYRPKINWFADAGVMSSDPALLQRHLGYSVGLNMTIPIFDGHQRKLESQKLSIRENTRSGYENYFKTQYRSQVQQLKIEMQTVQKTQALLKTQLATAKELIEMIKKQLNNGNVTVIELINTMKNYLSVSRSMNQAQVREFGIMNELNYLMQQ
ncbi:MAG: TolC family protein [Ignavibacteria bacterium]|nr:TolC family protein [Ignavibacteria bacterium]